MFIDSTMLKVNNYHFWRAERTAHGGGIAAYVRSDLPCDRKRKLEFNIVESINIEILIADNKWLISRVYRPQTAINISMFIDSTMLNSNFLFLSHGKSDRTYAAIPPPWAVRSALQKW
jgi:hypothetical protein